MEEPFPRSDLWRVNRRKHTGLAAAPVYRKTALSSFMRIYWPPASNVVGKGCSQLPFLSLGARNPSMQTEAELSIEKEEKVERGALFTDGGLDVLTGFHCFL